MTPVIPGMRISTSKDQQYCFRINNANITLYVKIITIDAEGGCVMAVYCLVYMFVNAA